MTTITYNTNGELSFNGTNFYQDSGGSLGIGPITVCNDSDSIITITLSFTGNITNRNNYIIVGSDNIIFDGDNSIINISTDDSIIINRYRGLFQDNTIYSNIIIQNIKIHTTSLLYNLNGTTGSGWFVGSGFHNCTAINCSSDGRIVVAGGGIFGSGCTNCIAINCHSSGYNSGGGIFGHRSENCTANNCYSSGPIMNLAGGIFGQQCNYNSLNNICTANNCYSTGQMYLNSGGIFGSNCNFESTNCQCIANSCYSLGNMHDFSGGIFGIGANSTSINCTATANFCYYNGDMTIGSRNGGIFSYNANVNSTSSICTANNCFNMSNIGSLNNYNSGGIFGSNCNENAVYSQCIVQNSFSIGNIYGDDTGTNGGIFGNYASSSCTATNCYSIGNVGQGCGGIFDSWCYGTSPTNMTATNCYSIGSISNNGGGIFGSFSNQCSAISCYSIGSIDINAGGIIGGNSQNCVASYCYNIGEITDSGGSIFGSNATQAYCANCYVPSGTYNNIVGLVSDVTIINCIAENGQNWNDSNANNTIGIDNSYWLSISPNTPFLLSSFSTNQMISPAKKIMYVYNPILNILKSNNTKFHTEPNGREFLYKVESYFYEPLLKKNAVLTLDPINLKDINCPSLIALEDTLQNMHFGVISTTFNKGYVMEAFQGTFYKLIIDGSERLFLIKKMSLYD